MTSLINYLEQLAKRELGEEIPPFKGMYCRFSIMFIGKSYKIRNEGYNVYWNYLKTIYSKSATIYLLGDAKNKVFIKDFFKKYKNLIHFYQKKEYTFKGILKLRDNQIEVTTYLLSIEKK